MFSAKEQQDDTILIREALAGNRKALEQLIKNHQDYVYNISLKLFLDPDDALDATQEVLIKVVTHLKSFKGSSSFRTWVYRIAFNHFLDMPRQKMELRLSGDHSGLEGFAEEVSQDEFTEAELEEVRILCSTAMLMCLNREQRLLYIVGEIFNADHRLGAELFNTSTSNYRVKLHRARTDLFNFVSGKCGLVDPRNPCRCPKKTKVLVERGIVNRSEFRFNRDFVQKISEIVAERKDEVSDEIQFNFQRLFRDSPFQVKRELDEILTGIAG
jgi:RNA polymerase sigma factor (sigma-70 family)